MAQAAAPIGTGSLGKEWTLIGAGAFGQVYKTRHLVWKMDVAIKLLHFDDGNSGSPLMEEAERMKLLTSPFVVRVLGIFQDYLPDPRCSSKILGLVMELMETGSVESLQRALKGPPPWPLAWRLAHQVALGMNYLHTLEPPLLHRDLKSSNVLLDDDLNAKLTDFGLSRVSTSAHQTQSSSSGPLHGTVAYMPPESFQSAYKPVRAYDIYSYGILLWSVFAGKSPYQENHTSKYLEFQISKGQRPMLEDIKLEQADGGEELLTLMKKCWDPEPSQRPAFEKSVEVTASVYLKHKRDLPAAVCGIQSILNSPSLHPNDSLLGRGREKEPPLSSVGSSAATPSQAHAPPEVCVDQAARREAPWKEDTVYQPSTSRHVAAAKAPGDKEAAKFVDDHWAQLIQDVTMVMAIADDLNQKNILHAETYAQIDAEKTTYDKMRKLQKPVRSGGVKVKAAFYSALRKHEPHLVDKLESPS